MKPKTAKDTQPTSVYDLNVFYFGHGLDLTHNLDFWFACGRITSIRKSHLNSLGFKWDNVLNQWYLWDVEAQSLPRTMKYIRSLYNINELGKHMTCSWSHNTKGKNTPPTPPQKNKEKKEALTTWASRVAKTANKSANILTTIVGKTKQSTRIKCVMGGEWSTKRISLFQSKLSKVFKKEGCGVVKVDTGRVLQNHKNSGCRWVSVSVTGIV